MPYWNDRHDDDLSHLQNWNKREMRARADADETARPRPLPTPLDNIRVLP